MNINKYNVYEEMIPELHGGGYLLGDGEYDANPVLDAAGAAGYQLLAPRAISCWRRGRTRIRGWGTTTRARIGCGASS